jgi:hypothetical protein
MSLATRAFLPVFARHAKVVITNSDWQFQFRLNALAGNLPGVKKASW